MRIGDTESYKTEYIQDGKKIVKRGLEPDCEHCCISWEDSSYEGECNDCGCCFNYEFDVPIWKCMLPYWVKRLIKRIKGW